jgi:23S rRNA (uracil1939-C5)-methyltransferase
LETFRRLGGIPFMEDELEVLEGTPFNYRSRAQVHWDGTHLGFKARRSESVIPIKHCMVLTENLNQVWDQDLTQFSLQSRTRIMECNTGIKSRGLAEVSLAGLTLQVNAEGFFQSNRLVQTRLINLLRDRLQGETLLDLYGGVGVFAAALASNFKKIWLVESQKESADCARKNLKATGARIFSGTVEAWARSFPKTQMDWVIVDPPRQGLKTKALAMLAQQTPQKIAYISCNPDTQARDLKALHHAGYALDELFLLDFYPQTPHIETLAILSYDSPPKDTTYV